MRPPSYTLHRKVFADLREEWLIRVNGNRWLESQHGNLVTMFVSTSYWRNQKAAEAACRKHWKEYLAQHVLIKSEYHFDPEGEL